MEWSKTTLFAALWMPFIIATIFSVDIRWIPYFFVVIPPFLIMVTNPSSDLLGLIIVLICFYLLFDYFQHQGENIFILTEEGVIYGYYMLLALSIANQKPVLTGIMLALCLMSRYIVMGWAVIYLYSQCILKKDRDSQKTIWAGAMTGMVILLISHSVSEVPNFIQLPGVYLRNVLLNPTHYKENILEIRHSLAYLFYPVRLRLLYDLSLVLAFGVPLILFLINYIYPFNNTHFFLLGGIKLSIVLFFGFMIIPFTYLVFTSCFFSLIGCYLISCENKMMDG